MYIRDIVKVVVNYRVKFRRRLGGDREKIGGINQERNQGQSIGYINKN